ncbi:hypothetical protein FHS31_002819 [Sphingomonas vulcanisoli]|uniref:Uncharacterized protein n=1 Tax=Sphingomonas vulcanisoli TaxID=1658060 RepID=A0ABX0TUI8_9SPHN|nr:hypothetical protein [Sphingomonas vulcanisoli]NIJ09187.1 hypothetical protein [Sphingomonas vulcanisoli]
MRAAVDMLVRALMDRGPCCVLAADERPWASVTFTGAHHTLRLVIAADEATAFLEGIEDAEFDLREHLLADIVVTESVILGERRMVLIEALTIERADVFPPQRQCAEGQGEGYGGTTCGTKRAFVPLAAA